MYSKSKVMTIFTNKGSYLGSRFTDKLAICSARDKKLLQPKGQQ